MGGREVGGGGKGQTGGFQISKRRISDSSHSVLMLVFSISHPCCESSKRWDQARQKTVSCIGCLREEDRSDVTVHNFAICNSFNTVTVWRRVIAELMAIDLFKTVSDRWRFHA